LAAAQPAEVGTSGATRAEINLRTKWLAADAAGLFGDYDRLTRGAPTGIGRMTADDPAQQLAQECADALWATDRASQDMGMKLESVAPGRATLSMTVRADMIGPGGTCSRGAIFIFADSALAFASNTRGQRVVAQHCDIVFDNPVSVGERVVAAAVERHLSGPKGLYDVRVETADGRVVAELRGLAHALGKRPIELNPLPD
jgi:acyl-CoA thioesterase